MPTRLIDLDAVVPATVDVRLAGKVYKLPGDVPVPEYLTISRLVEQIGSKEAGEADQALVDLYECVLALFRVHQPKLKELPIGPQRLGAIVFAIYSGLVDEDAGEGERPRKAAGTKSSSRRKSTKSRSSR